MGLFQYAVLGIGIIIIILLSVIANDLKESRYYLKVLSSQLGSCHSFLQAIEHNILELNTKTGITQKK